ncbi:NUDIX domain-containing protein [Ornithinicoccus halotolerans]|uniref:NUDIX domain-containing protein n=1 Tax=Ornithinicoccus halotolerans TaxID=1748220 RepID=UPI001E48F2FE|nr:NUDIX hydrolase [Ornithinicoccus halotolerans]
MTDLRLRRLGPHLAALELERDGPVPDPEQVDAEARAAFADGVHRVEAEVPVDRPELRRALQRAGMRPEGISRGRGSGDGHGGSRDVTRLARLADDPPPGTRAAFLGVLNAALPTKRLIAQGLVRDEAGAVLLCELVYKTEWDLPGGVVDPRESPAHTVLREIEEELAVRLPPESARLAAINWLPPYRQWDDALLCVYDLGVVPDIAERAVLEPAELRALHWRPPEELDGHVAPYVARHVRAVLAADPAAGPLYLEDGLPPAGR